jgi:hypothetical protein
MICTDPISPSTRDCHGAVSELSPFCQDASPQQQTAMDISIGNFLFVTLK